MWNLSLEMIAAQEHIRTNHTHCRPNRFHLHTERMGWFDHKHYDYVLSYRIDPYLLLINFCCMLRFYQQHWTGSKYSWDLVWPIRCSGEIWLTMDVWRNMLKWPQNQQTIRECGTHHFGCLRVDVYKLQLVFCVVFYFALPFSFHLFWVAVPRVTLRFGKMPENLPSKKAR